MQIPGYIQWARNSRKQREFPILVFSAGVDFVTEGMLSLTSTKHREVVATMATEQEWKQYDPRAIERRVNEALARSDLRFVKLLRVEDSCLIYSDLDGNSEARATRKQSLDEFIKEGGVVTRHAFT